MHEQADSSPTPSVGNRYQTARPISRSRAKHIGIVWSPTMAYALGLMATDGNLSRRHGRLSLVSANGRYWFFATAKAESMRLLGWILYSPDVPCLARKRASYRGTIPGSARPGFGPSGWAAESRVVVHWASLG